jgi:hypothetical protein
MSVYFVYGNLRMVPAPPLFGILARTDPAKKALAGELVEDPPLFRLGFRGHPDAVLEADMGIPPSDDGPGKGSEFSRSGSHPSREAGAR